MTRTVLAALLLSLSAAACEQTPTETNSNASASKTASAPASPTPVPVQTPEPIASAKPQVKAGDKVKFSTNGATSEATVVSVDEKAGQVTIKIQGETREKTVAIGDIIR